MNESEKAIQALERALGIVEQQEGLESKESVKLLRQLVPLYKRTGRYTDARNAERRIAEVRY